MDTRKNYKNYEEMIIMFRIKGDAIIKNIKRIYPVTSTGGNMQSSDVGSLVLMSSGRGSLAVPTSDAMFLASTGAALANTLPLAGILIGVSESSGTTPGSTVSYALVQPIANNEVLEVDYSTIDADITRSDAYLLTTNLGNFVHVLGSGTSSGTVRTAKYIDASSGATALGSSNPFQMLGFSTKFKTIDVIFRSPSYASTDTGVIALGY